MNEGWASYWHSTIMTRQGLAPADLICYCDHHSGTMASSPTRLNPYKLGIELFRDIEDRWNRGRFGKEYEECDDLDARRHWDTQAGRGRQKIFEVRKIHNDLTFIDTFLTLEFCREHKLFSFGYNEGTDTYDIESREFPKIKASPAVQPHQHGPPANRRPRRQLQKPRRTLPGTRLQRPGTQNQRTPTTHWPISSDSVGPARAYRDHLGRTIKRSIPTTGTSISRRSK